MLNCQNLILFILPLPLFGILFLIFTPPKQIKLLKLIALNFSCFSFTSFLIVWGFFKKSVGSFQFTKTLIWFPFLNLNVTLEVDGTSLFFIILTILLISLCLLANWNTVNSNLKEFLIAFLFLDFLLVGSFCVLEIFLFSVLFKNALILMFLIISIWGFGERKILASYYFFIYTLIGSILVLLSILHILYQIGTTNYKILIISGIFLSMHYTTYIDLAFNSIEYVMKDGPNGSLIRDIRASGVSMFFIVVYGHVCQGLYYDSYTELRQALRCFGVVLLLLIMVIAFVDYVLSWYQMSLCRTAATISSITATLVADKFSKFCLQGSGLNFVLSPTSSKIFNFKIIQLNN